MNFDVIIVGGGMVGAATACALQPHFSKIALIDASPLDTSDDHRLIALNHSSISFLKNLTIWPSLETHAAVIKTVHISHQGHFGHARLTAEEAKLPFLGYVIPAKYINEALYNQFKNVTLFRPAQLTTLISNSESVSVGITLPQGSKNLTSDLLIAADGTHSTVRQLAHIPCESTSYDQSALVTTTELYRSHSHIAYERFLTNGAIAMLPLVGNRVATIWTDQTTNIHSLLALNENDFLQNLQQQFGYRLGKFKSVSQRFTYPLQRVQANQKVKDRILLLGNAAHTLHPIAAQGFNLALYEIAVICDALAQTGFDLRPLTHFANQQETISTRLSHHLASFFTYDFFPLTTLRELGLVAFDLCRPLKNYFMQRLLGRSKALPRLLREPTLYENPSGC